LRARRLALAAGVLPGNATTHNYKNMLNFETINYIKTSLLYKCWFFLLLFYFWKANFKLINELMNELIN